MMKIREDKTFEIEVKFLRNLQKIVTEFLSKENQEKDFDIDEFIDFCRKKGVTEDYILLSVIVLAFNRGNLAEEEDEE